MNHNLNRIAPLIQDEIENGIIAGASICIIRDDNEIYQQNFGYSNIEQKIPMKSNVIFRLCSMTKPITAVATMILYERGELDLFSPVSKYLDGFRNQKVLTENGFENVKREVTIKDLLDMTSGIVYPDSSFEAGIQMDSLFHELSYNKDSCISINTIDFCNLIGKQPLEFHPGEHWRYGASADVLGAVIEIITGKKLSVFFNEEIFEPLGMVDTSFFVPKNKLDRFSKLYEYQNDSKTLKECNWNFLGLSNFLKPPVFESAGAGLVSTIEDYRKFSLMLLHKGTYKGVKLLGRKTADFLTSNQLSKEQALTYNWDSLYGYGYGNLMRIMLDTTKAGSNGSVGEYGWDGWAGNYFFIDPVENVILIFMIQKCYGGNPSLIRNLRSIIYSSLD